MELVQVCPHALLACEGSCQCLSIAFFSTPGSAACKLTHWTGGAGKTAVFYNTRAALAIVSALVETYLYRCCTKSLFTCSEACTPVVHIPNRHTIDGRP